MRQRQLRIDRRHPKVAYPGVISAPVASLLIALGSALAARSTKNCCTHLPVHGHTHGMADADVEAELPVWADDDVGAPSAAVLSMETFPRKTFYLTCPFFVVRIMTSTHFRCTDIAVGGDARSIAEYLIASTIRGRSNSKNTRAPRWTAASAPSPGMCTSRNSSTT